MWSAPRMVCLVTILALPSLPLTVQPHTSDVESSCALSGRGRSDSEFTLPPQASQRDMALTDRRKWELRSPAASRVSPHPHSHPAFWRKFKRFFCSPGFSRSVASIIPQLRKHPPPYVVGRAWVSPRWVIEGGALKVGRAFPS